MGSQAAVKDFELETAVFSDFVPRGNREVGAFFRELQPGTD